MNVVAWILGIVLCVVFVAAGAPKLVDAGNDRRRLGYSLTQWRLIGVAELVAVVGLLIGLIWRGVEYLAIGAAVVLASMMLGALLAHARVEDEGAKAIPAAAMLVLSIVFIVFISLR